MPQDDALIAEPKAPTYAFTWTGKMFVESKADMKKRGMGAALGYGGAKCPAILRTCREHARRCAELAALVATPEEREHFRSHLAIRTKGR
jgi:hypothetical protein